MATTGIILTGASPGSTRDLSARIDAFVHGEHELSGLELYYELERSTRLRDFHTMLRHGPRNRTRSGLQQSYGDHNRLLLFGLDQLVAGDLAWYRTRVESPESVSDEHLAACLSAVASLSIDRRALVALWLAAALHDCGMLGGSPPDIDVEDGVAFSRDLVDALCPPAFVDLALFAIRNHDYIKNIFNGEVSPAFIADQVHDLDEQTRGIALCALGMIQVAGAASLGEGRLTPFRLGIFDACFEGGVLDESSPMIRLARLLSPQDESTGRPDAETATRSLASLSNDARSQLISMLERVSILGWRKWRRLHGVLSDAQLAWTLAVIAEQWTSTNADHVVLTPSSDVTIALGAQPHLHHLANGTTALVLGPREAGPE